MKHLPEKLKEELKYSKYSQKEIAEKLGISVSNISNWKKGKNLPSLEMFYQLCILLEISADDILEIKK